MKKLITVLVALWLSLPNLVCAGPWDSQWKKVDQAIMKGLPKTAIEELDPILKAATERKAYGEAVKALATKISLQGSIEGEKAEEKITRMQAAISEAPAEMKPTMEAILAHWFWQYFQQNRWRFTKRTITGEQGGNDFATWDLQRIFSEIDRHFSNALLAENVLKQTPVSTFDGVLEKGSVPDSVRPTMFDFLAHEALRFYETPEQGAGKFEDEIELSADSPALAPVEEFLRWTPERMDRKSQTLKALALYQKLLTFHQDDVEKSAFADADLWRLHFAYNMAVGEDKDERYIAALAAFVTRWSDNELSARALSYWASVLEKKQKFTEAHEVASRGVRAFPQSDGGISCFNIIRQIEAKSLSIETERVFPFGSEKMTVSV